ncbi:DUF3857 domain-containing transglutaminase family protein [Flavobacterium sp. K77]|uniref:DUF3857 domain-containing protein n=1 Tax=Flavobacterium sp. K77 TaxID=2910676 RepID=UPI001F20A1C0|nr:DUF3857 domain-containing transglutaminase family protein [Flavobacterium sp. K77]MCF6141658.1 DUF3857 domain-containing transglutaminase family protein [Flavobacterium sp. K77]
MRITTLVVLFAAIFATNLNAQKINYTAINIADSLKNNANAVVRLNQLDISIASQRSMNIKTKRVVTVLNELGLKAVDAVENFDKRRSIKNIEAVVYDIFGNEIKKIKRKDFKEQSASGGSTLFSDGRFIYLEYTPTQYPFTIVYESEIETSNTAFIPTWSLLSEYNVSIEKSIVSVNVPQALGFRKKEFNFANFKIKTIVDSPTQLQYEAVNIVAEKYEDYTPAAKVFPRVMMGLENFNLEGVDGTAKNWKEYGKWFSENILIGTTNLSDEAKAKIKTLVGTETDPIKKAKIVYKFVQEKSRYVSVQVGIGGFKPMLASDVDRLGYGDCKALSNYTRALLEVVGVPSYYTELFGDRDIRNIEADFFSVQGNHVILCVPNADDSIFLECTSQDDPFGFQANFTDDRDVVVMKPEGGEIIHTKKYHDKDNGQISTGTYSLDAQGNLTGAIKIVSTGSQYSSKASTEKLQPTEKDAHYKQYWTNINNLKITKINLQNDKDKIEFIENITLSADNYASNSGGKMMLAINAYNQFSGTIKRIRNRKNPFEIPRGYLDTDEIAIVLPSGFQIEFLPANFELKTKYGDYKTEIIKKDHSNLVYKRTILIKKGIYANSDYDSYRLFMEQIAKNDNAKIILTKNQ